MGRFWPPQYPDENLIIRQISFGIIVVSAGIVMFTSGSLHVIGISIMIVSTIFGTITSVGLLTAYFRRWSRKISSHQIEVPNYVKDVIERAKINVQSVKLYISQGENKASVVCGNSDECMP